jgi:hypothetical protein
MPRPRTIKKPRRFLVTVEDDTHQAIIRLTALKSLKERRTITLSEYVRNLLDREAGYVFEETDTVMNADPTAIENTE